MLKAALTERDHKEKIRPKIKIKRKPNEIKKIPEFYSVKEQNSNSKSNINSTKPTEVFSNNSQNNDKIILNSMTDDKDLEILLSELKNTSNLKSKNSEQENYNEGDDIDLNNCYINRVNINEYLNFGKKKDNDNIDFIDFQEPGNEISQRVHECKAKIHPPIKEKKLEKSKIKISIAGINNLNRNTVYKKTLECESSFKKKLNKIKYTKRNSSNLKDALMKKFSSFSQKKKKILFRYQTDKNKIHSTGILDKPSDEPKKCNRIQLEKKIHNYCLKLNKRTINNNPKNFKTSFLKKIRFSNKNPICSPKRIKMNMSINYESDSKDKDNKKKFRDNNSCTKSFGGFYIRTRYKRDKIKSKLLGLKNNVNISNPFANKILIIKNSPSFLQPKCCLESFIGKKFMKKKTDIETYKTKNKNESSLKFENWIKNSNRNYSNVYRNKIINIIL